MTLKIIIEEGLIYGNYHNKLCINLKEYELYICVQKNVLEVNLIAT